MIVVCSLLRFKADKRGTSDKTLLCNGEEHYHCVLCRSLDGSEMRALLERRHTSWGNLERDLLVSFILFLFSQPAASWGHFHIGACFRSKLPFPNFPVPGPGLGCQHWRPTLKWSLILQPSGAGAGGHQSGWICFGYNAWENVNRATMEADLIENAVSVWLQFQLSFNISKRAKSMSACSTIFRQKSIEQKEHNQMIYNL